MLTAQLRRHRRHLSGVLVDNALSSASNFASSVIALRVGGIDGFASAGICLVLLRIVVAVSRSYAVEPLVTAAPTATGVSTADALATLRASTSSGVVLAALSWLYLWAFDIPLSGGLVFLMTFGAVTMCQGEAVRSLLLLRKQYACALWYDGLWVVLLLAATPWLLNRDEPGVVLAIWALTGAAAMVATLPVLRRHLTPGRPGHPVVPSARMRAGIAAETAMDRASNQLSIVIIASAASPALATGITGARTVLSPLNPLLFAMFNFLLPVSAGVSNHRRQRLIHLIMVAAPLGVLAVAAMAVITPSTWLELVVGSAWSSARPVFIPVSLLFASAIVRQLVVAVARGGNLFGEARSVRYLASVLAFAPCLLVALGSQWVVLSLYFATILSLLGALLVGQSIVIVLRDRETPPC